MSYSHLSSEERYAIQQLHRLNYSQLAIAEQLGRSHSTIGRELKRNAIQSGYDSVQASQMAQKRRQKARHAKRRDHPPLVKQVLAWLHADWSPEIIVAYLKKQFPRDSKMRVCIETIYKWIYADARCGGTLYQALWRQHKKRKTQRKGLKRILIPNRTGIEARPPGATNRSRYGHWEGDTVEGKKGRGGLATHADRKSRFLIARLLTDKRAATFSDATCKSFNWVPSSLLRSVTYDNGSENADHECTSITTGLKVFFADPYSPWQRGTNEQANGLLRHYFPKGTDFSKVTQEEVDAVVEKINKRPRKCLGYQAPYDVFAQALRCALAT